jgi:parallel beta-helix repeat protein
MRRTGLVYVVSVSLLLVALFGAVLNAPLVKGDSGTIYIRADGSIDPSTAPISSIDNVTYTFTDNINDSIVVERDNIVIDGAGYSVQGSGSGYGVVLSSRSNVTIEKASIKGFDYGIWLYYSSNNSILGNNIITHNGDCIWLNEHSNNNNISRNNIAGHSYGNGISLTEFSSYNSIFGNSVTNNGYGIVFYEYSNNNMICGNNVTANINSGIELHDGSSNNTIFENDITNNSWGICVYFGSDNNSIFHNNFVGNLKENAFIQESQRNMWDNGYPSGGNYWSNYTGTDANRDGIGDSAYVIDANNTDHYPLMTQYTILEFPSFFILPLFMIATLLAALVLERKCLVYKSRRDLT